MIQFLNLLNSIHPLRHELVDHLANVLKTNVFPKKTFLLEAGQVCQHIYFIESGLVRCFYLKNGNDVSSWFMKEGDFIISVESFFLQRAGQENIQTLEDTVAYSITFNELQTVYERFPEFNYVGRLLTEKYYTLSEQRLQSFRMQRANERYEFMQLHQPDLIRRIPSNYIASYLGIAKETLSRIRARKPNVSA